MRPDLKPAPLRVSLLYTQPRPLVDRALERALVEVLRDLPLSVTSRWGDGKSRLTLHTSGPDIRVLGADSPLPARAFARRRHAEGAPPADPQAERRRRQHRHRVTLEIAEPEAGGGTALTPPQQVALAHRLLRRLAGLAEADLVYWHRSAALQRIEDFLSGQRQTPARRRALLPEIVDDIPPEGEDVFAKLEAKMPEETISLSVVAGPPATLPRLTDGSEGLRAIFGDPPAPEPAAEEALSLPARLSVYVLNATVMIFSFPIGLALLIYNILRGEDLRMTLRTLALTGTALGVMGFARLEHLLPLG